MTDVKIIPLKKKTKVFKDFKKKEWIKIHKKHFGIKHEENYWKTKPLILKAVEDGYIVGALTAELTAGVLHISELIIKDTQRGNGFGKKLIQEAEKWAKKNRGHKIILDTGVSWKAVNFYTKLGFNKTAKLQKYYSKVDFFVMTKEI